MIQINGEIWRVRIVPPYHPILYRRGNPALGCCDDITKCIYISNILSQSEMRNVLCHELTHAVMFSYNVAMGDEVEEVVAETVATFGNEIMILTHMTYDKMLGYK